MKAADNRVAREILRSAITKEVNFEEIMAESLEEWALVILWSATEPQRIGEIALLGNGGVRWVLGRSPSEEMPSDPTLVCTGRGESPVQPVTFFRQRPLGTHGGTPPESGSPFLLGAGISRKQLELRPSERGIHLKNIGRCSLLVNGKPMTSGMAEVGATIHLRDQILLFCTRRPGVLPACRDFPAAAVRGFGEPDAFGVVGESPTIWRLRERAAVLAAGRANILILGDSGAGKELTAQTLHGLSSRRDQPLIATNISAIASGLAAVQLFGNRKGFPNPQMPESKGLIGAADGATLFLDEIGDMPLEVQPMFLRVTEERREYQRLGEEDRPPRHSDFRLLGATNRPEKLRIELKRRFPRTIEIPRLQERREDIPLLVRHILNEYRSAGDAEATRFFSENQPRLHPLFIEYLIHHDYATHVAEIGLLLGQAMAQSRGSTIVPCLSWLQSCKCPAKSSPPQPFVTEPEQLADTLWREISTSGKAAAEEQPDAPPSTPTETVFHLASIDDPKKLVLNLKSRFDELSESERKLLCDLIDATYKECRGDLTKASALLGLTRFQLYRLLHRLRWKPVRGLCPI